MAPEAFEIMELAPEDDRMSRRTVPAPKLQKKAPKPLKRLTRGRIGLGAPNACRLTDPVQSRPTQYPRFRSTTLRSGSPRSNALIWRAMAAATAAGAEMAALCGLT